MALHFLGPRLYWSLSKRGAATALLPTGNIVDVLRVPGIGRIEATLLTEGNTSVFIEASVLGVSGRELPAEINTDEALLACCELIRAHVTVVIELAQDMATASRKRPATPKMVLVVRVTDYVSSVRVMVGADQVELLARILSMGKMHHAFYWCRFNCNCTRGRIARPGCGAQSVQDVSRNASRSCKNWLCSGHLIIGVTVRHGKGGW